MFLEISVYTLRACLHELTIRNLRARRDFIDSIVARSLPRVVHLIFHDHSDKSSFYIFANS